MKMIALLFFIISFSKANISAAQQTENQTIAVYGSEDSICQIATFKDHDISKYCNGIVIFSNETNTLLVGIGEKKLKKFLSFSGEFTKKFYSFNQKEDYPLLMNVVEVSDEENTRILTNGKTSLCFFAATNIHKSVMIRCHAKGIDGSRSELLMHVQGMLE